MVRISTAGTQADPVVHLYGKGLNLDSYVSVDGHHVFSSIGAGEDGWKGPVVWGLRGRLRIEVQNGVGVEGVLMQTVLDGSRVVDRMATATHIVVDQCLTKERVVEKLGFDSFEKLRTHLESNELGVITPQWVTALAKSSEPTLPSIDNFQWPGLIVQKERKKKRPADWIPKKREKTADFLNFSGPTEISAASIDNPMITKIITQRAKAAGKDGSNGGERTTIGAIQADEGGIIIKRCINLGVLKPLDPERRVYPAKQMKPPLCDCDDPRPAILSSCKRIESSHFGRTFFKCGLANVSLQCNFIQWIDEAKTTAPSRVKQASPQRTPKNRPIITTGIPRCRCDKPAQRRECKSNKNGNQGRHYYCCCLTGKLNKCQFFVWADDLQRQVDAMVQDKTGLPPRVPTPEKIANFLNELSKAHSEGANNVTDKWRTYTYKKSSQIVQNFHLPLEKDNEENFQVLDAHRGIGEKTMQKIREFAATGQSSRLKAFEKDKTRQAISVISKVWGLGAKTAKILVSQGIQTIEDLRRESREGRINLTAQQVIGLRVYEDLLKPIDRADITKIGDAVRKAVNELCPGTDLDIMGSYRRGAQSGHDVDCLITNAKYIDSTPLNLIEKLVIKLEKDGFMTDHLSMPSREKKFGDQYDSMRWYKGEIEDKLDSQEHTLTKGVERLPEINKNRDKQSYMGVCQLNGVHKRIDIKFYPRRQLPFAQLYFTGNAYFNRSMRLYAKTVGYSLSDSGLFETMRKRIDGQNYVVSQGATLAAETEEDVFKLMGLVYVAPEDRNAYDAVATAKLDGLDVEDKGVDRELSQDVRELDGDLGGSPSFWAEEGREGKAGGSDCGSDFGDFWLENEEYQYDNPEP
ncbi:hypothetical protein TrRE_jg4866 [Triparma retinervis]|uniref:GRF-type domain-containing protein n=1 Tax=Triparma retinervis TaxID=2557542 RepID=A0A9W7A2J3_9STRA|nr:hypothetical protein TrRE_jg4866 [Triparma retinervis]